MEHEKREALARGREFLAEALKGIDAALLAQETIERAEALAQEAAALPADIEAMRKHRKALASEIKAEEERLSNLKLEFEALERDWHELRRTAAGGKP